MALDVAELLRQELRARRGSDAEKDAQRTHYQLYQAGMGLLKRYDREGNIDQAVESFQLALERNLDYAPAHAGLAEAYWRRYDRTRDRMYLDQALTHGERAVELDPHLAATQISLALAQMSAGKEEESEAGFEQALQLDPSNAKAYFGYGRLRQAQGQIEDAEARFEKALLLQTDYWDALTELGALCYSTGRYEEARSAFLRTVELQPDNKLAREPDQRPPSMKAVGYRLERISPRARTLKVVAWVAAAGVFLLLLVWLWSL